MNWHAFFREEEYKELLGRYPNTANEIRSRAVKDSSSYLLRYREVKEFTELNAFYAELKPRELCWTDSPIATLSEFTYSIQRQWVHFAELASTSEKIYVFEAVFFQHQIHDLLRHYQAADRQIEQHIHGIADQIACHASCIDLFNSAKCAGAAGLDILYPFKTPFRHGTKY